MTVTINGSVKRNRNFGFELQSSHVIDLKKFSFSLTYIAGSIEVRISFVFLHVFKALLRVFQR